MCWLVSVLEVDIVTNARELIQWYEQSDAYNRKPSRSLPPTTTPFLQAHSAAVRNTSAR